MTEKSPLPANSADFVTPLLGLWSMPLAMMQGGLTMCAELSHMWASSIVRPHFNPREGHEQLTVPEPFRKDHEHDLFA